MSEEMIEPCPFCGAEAVMMRDDGSCYKVKCSNAWCFAERACWRQTERAAVKDWNTRAYNPNERLREALEAMVYETTHLSAAEDDGSHWAKISAEALARARSALSPLPQGEDT